MSSAEQRIKAASDQIFNRFCRALTKLDPITAGAIGLAGGAAILSGGAYIEIGHQAEIARAAGQEALAANRELGPDSVLG